MFIIAGARTRKAAVKYDCLLHSQINSADMEHISTYYIVVFLPGKFIKQSSYHSIWYAVNFLSGISAVVLWQDHLDFRTSGFPAHGCISFGAMSSKKY